MKRASEIPIGESDAAAWGHGESNTNFGPQPNADPEPGERHANEGGTAEVAPVDLFGNLERPPFPTHLLPTAIADFAEDQAALMGLDPALVGMAGVVVLASCIDDRVKIQPKRHDPTWTESARLWFAPIGLPSAKKSPALKKALGPAFAIDKEWREAARKALAEWAKECERVKKSDSGEDMPPQPETKRLIYEDTTVEKMADVMSRCEPRGALVFRDELTGWLASMDAYKNGSGKDRAAWLEAYNGHHLAVDRVTRGSTYVENWSACVIGGIQPSVIHEYAGATNHDGMLQRFILLFACDADAGQDRLPNMRAKEDYEGLIRHASRLQPGTTPVRLSDGAHKVREALFAKLRVAVRSLPNHFLTAAIGKWEGTFARLLLVWHVADCSPLGEHPCAVLVSEDSAEAVASLMWNTMLPHAIAFYAGIDATEDKARDVAALILARGWERFTVKRDLDRNLRNYRKWRPWEIRDTMVRLQALGWITRDGDKIDPADGQPVAYRVNAAVHRLFKDHAEREKQRRAEVAAIMREMARRD